MGDSAEFAGASPFHPFVLKGHEFIQAYLKIHMGCVVTHDGEVAEISSVPVATSFYGFSRTTNIDIIPFAIRYADSCK